MESTTVTFLWVVGIIGGLGLIAGFMFGGPVYGRYQSVQEAQNQIQINEMVAKSTQQLIDNEKQKAQIRIEQAKGIAEAQRLINATRSESVV